MLLSQKLANFTRGEADSLRKGMGKKIKSVIDELKPKFVDGCKKNGYDETIVEKIGPIGKNLYLMLLINRIQHAML